MSFTVGDLVAEFLAEAGVRTAFGIVSVHNIPLLDSIGRDGRIRFVPTRGEIGGGLMADAYARVDGGLGVLITSTGPGAANAVGGLVEARFGASPVLHITGTTATPLATRDAGPVHDFPEQHDLLAACCKSVWRPRHAGQVLEMLCAAANDALSDPRGPVSLEIAADLQAAPVTRPATYAGLIQPRKPAPPPVDQRDALFEKVRAARRPMLWLGDGARSSRQAVLDLLDLGFGAVTSWHGRALVPEDHARTLGALHGNGAPAIEDFYDTVDLMIVVGSRLRGHETLDGQLRLPEHLVKIDLDGRAAHRFYPAELIVAGDAEFTLRELNERLRASDFAVDPAFGADLQRARATAAAAYRDTLGPYADFPAQLTRVMPPDAVWVRDGTVAGHTWAHRLVPLAGPRSSVHPVSGSIGAGLPFAIGAALAAAPAGRKVIAIAGDGGLAMNLNELWTAVQEQTDFCLIIMNDSIYAAIRFIQDASQAGRRFYSALEGPDIKGLAALAGVPFWRVSQADQFGATLRQALATAGPTLVEIDMSAIGPVPPYGHRARPRAATTG